MFSSLVENALRIAVEAHDGQVRRGEDAGPYVVHPLHVAIMLARWGMDDDVIVAGILHDVVEDCDDWTVERVDREFGPQVHAGRRPEFFNRLLSFYAFPAFMPRAVSLEPKHVDDRLDQHRQHRGPALVRGCELTVRRASP